MDTTEGTGSSGSPAPDERDGAQPRGEGRRTFRQTLVRVMVVQVVALALLWLLQATYGG